MIADPDECAVCHGPKSACQDPDAQHAWVIEARRCFKTRAVQEYMERRAKSDKHTAALHVTARIDPARRKSAR